MDQLNIAKGAWSWCATHALGTLRAAYSPNVVRQRRSSHDLRRRFRQFLALSAKYFVRVALRFQHSDFREKHLGRSALSLERNTLHFALNTTYSHLARSPRIRGARLVAAYCHYRLPPRVGDERFVVRDAALNAGAIATSELPQSTEADIRGTRKRSSKSIAPRCEGN
jgi:hypothetical protein